MDPEYGMTKEIKQLYDTEMSMMDKNTQKHALEWKKHFTWADSKQIL